MTSIRLRSTTACRTRSGREAHSFCDAIIACQDYNALAWRQDNGSPSLDLIFAANGEVSLFSRTGSYAYHFNGKAEARFHPVWQFTTPQHLHSFIFIARCSSSALYSRSSRASMQHWLLFHQAMAVGAVRRPRPRLRVHARQLQRACLPPRGYLPFIPPRS